MHPKAMSEIYKYKSSGLPSVGGTKTRAKIKYSLILSKA